MCVYVCVSVCAMFVRTDANVCDVARCGCVGHVLSFVCLVFSSDFAYESVPLPACACVPVRLWINMVPQGRDAAHVRVGSSTRLRLWRRVL
jgi:hypothetical protein